MLYLLPHNLTSLVSFIKSSITIFFKFNNC